MENVDEFSSKIREREADPAWREQQRQQAERIKRDAEKALGAAQREALAKLALPPKDIELLRGPGIRHTPAVEVLDQPTVLTVLSGGAGCGKTVAASWWLHSWLMDPAHWSAGEEFRGPKLLGSAVFVTAARLARWDRYDDAAMGLLLRATRLVVDDLGVEFLDAKGSFLALLDEVVNERYASRRATVLTTNMPVETFRERYGERIASRIREVGQFIALGEISLRSGAGQLSLDGAVRVGGATKPAPVTAPDPRLPREPDDEAPQREFVR